MGSFYTNLQVRTEDYDGTIDALRNCKAFPVYISKKAVNGWISVFPQSTEGQDQDHILKLIESISRYMETGVFGLLVHDSDIFWYALAESGTVVDAYDSDPGYFDGKESGPKGGKSSALLPYCVSGTSEIEVAALLHRKRKEPNMSETTDMMRALQSGDMSQLQKMASLLNDDDVFRGDGLARKFGELIGLTEQSVCLGYNYIKQAHGRVPNTQHVQDPDKRVEKKTKEGLPSFTAESAMDMSDQVRGMGRMMGLAPNQERTGQKPTSLQRQVGDDLSWIGSVNNTGGFSQGIKLTVTGDVEDFFTDMVAYVSKAPSGSPQDDDFELADPEDESFWPYVARFSRGASPKEMIAVLPDFKYEGRLVAQFPFKITGAGAGTFNVRIEPSANAESAANFTFELNAQSPKPTLKLVQTKAGTHDVGPVEIEIPGEYEVNVRSQQELNVAALTGKAGLLGMLVARKGTDKSVSLAIVESSSAIAKKDLENILSEIRIKQKMRSFESTPIGVSKIGGLHFQHATWKCADFSWSGVVAIGRLDDQVLLYAGQGKQDEPAEYEEILQSIKLTE